MVEGRDETVSTPESLEGPPPDRNIVPSSSLDSEAAKLDVEVYVVSWPATASPTGGVARLRDGAVLLRAEYALPLVE